MNGIIARSPAATKQLALAHQAALIDTTVLIMGETGTGKGLLAGWIHEQSRRAASPFIVVDCTTIPENLFESELFGYEKGAFTGAEKQKLGRFELANKGTLFLDEIGEVPPQVQIGPQGPGGKTPCQESVAVRSSDRISARSWQPTAI